MAMHIHIDVMEAVAGALSLDELKASVWDLAREIRVLVIKVGNKAERGELEAMRRTLCRDIEHAHEEGNRAARIHELREFLQGRMSQIDTYIDGPLASGDGKGWKPERGGAGRRGMGGITASRRRASPSQAQKLSLSLQGNMLPRSLGLSPTVKWREDSPSVPKLREETPSPVTWGARSLPPGWSLQEGPTGLIDDDADDGRHVGGPAEGRGSSISMTEVTGGLGTVSDGRSTGGVHGRAVASPLIHPISLEERGRGGRGRGTGVGAGAWDVPVSRTIGGIAVSLLLHVLN